MNLKGITQNSTIEQIYDAFASDPDVVNKIGKVKNIKSYNFPLNKREIKNRLSNKENTKENLIFDFVTTLQFNHIQIVANAIENVGRVLRPEGNAIKQSIKATREFDENVKKYRNPKDSINEILYAVNDEGRAISVMDAIYPLRGSSIDVENSGYKYLAAFYEKGILPSIEVNRKLIPTESDSFIALMKSIQLALGTEESNGRNRAFKADWQLIDKDEHIRRRGVTEGTDLNLAFRYGGGEQSFPLIVDKNYKDIPEEMWRQEGYTSLAAIVSDCEKWWSDEIAKHHVKFTGSVEVVGWTLTNALP